MIANEVVAAKFKARLVAKEIFDKEWISQMNARIEAGEKAVIANVEDNNEDKDDGKKRKAVGDVEDKGNSRIAQVADNEEEARLAAEDARLLEYVVYS